MRKRKNLIGQTFGRLTVIAEGKTRESDNKRKQYYWLCQCSCGSQPKEINQNSLLSGEIISCGCYHSEHNHEYGFKHGMSHTRIYTIWSGMIQRCCNPNAKNYPRYGGRGITVCEEWKEFKKFYEWSKISGYSDNLTIERLDNNGNYCPENCTWITKQKQMRNTRRNHYIKYNDEELTLTEWARKFDMNVETLRYQVNHNNFKSFVSYYNKIKENDNA